MDKAKPGVEDFAIEKAEAALDKLEDLLSSPNDNVALQAATTILTICKATPAAKPGEDKEEDKK